jgi:quercetin dioxygenase-like cupin family protein
MRFALPALPTRRASIAIAAGAAALIGAGFGGGLLAAGQSQVHPVMAQPLANLPGNALTAVVVDFPPGAASKPHHHAGSVFVYVLAGEVRSGVDGAAPQVYRAGEAYFEPPGSHHTVSANASATEPAKVLAVLVAEQGAKLTTYDPE